jgi:hypothetical protein
MRVRSQLGAKRSPAKAGTLNSRVGLADEPSDMGVERMTAEFPTKRRRGGQPGNQNAKGKRGGNRTGRRHRFARGNRLGGAPLGNQNAKKKRPAAHKALLKEFDRDPEAAAWIRAHAAELDSAGFKDDNERDRALFDGYLGLTPETLSANGLEFKLRLYTTIEVDRF